MPGFPTAPAVQTVTDKLATIAPELGNVPGYYVYLKDPIAGTIYESATSTDSGGNWSIAGVTMGLTYQYAYGIHPNTAYPFRGVYVASNPASAIAAAVSTPAGGSTLSGGGLIGTAASPLAGVVAPWGLSVFNAKSPQNPSGAAVGDSVADDSASLQAALTAAIAVDGTVVIPGVGANKNYKVTTALSIVPASGTQAFVNIQSDGGQAVIQWAGGNSTAVFSTLGWQYSSVRGVWIQIPAVATSVSGWLVDTDATRQSTNHLSWYDSSVSMNATSTSCVGWNMGLVGGGAGDISYIEWHNCHVASGATGNSCAGWLNQTQNSIYWNWYGGDGQKLDCVFSNSPNKFAARQGGSAMFWHGFNSESTLFDFYFHAYGEFGIYGGRFEVGQKFISTNSTSVAPVITVSGAHLSGYIPGDNIVFNIQSPAQLILQNVEADGSDYTAAFITLNGFTGQGSLNVTGGVIRTTADPPYTIGSGIWSVVMQNVGRSNASLQTTNYFAPRYGALTGTFAPAYGVTVTGDITRGKRQKVTVTDGVGFTLTAPTGYDGAELIWEIFNNTAGAIGAIAVDAAQLLAGGTAFVGPGAAKRRMLAMGYDSTNSKWVELYRTTADT